VKVAHRLVLRRRILRVLEGQVQVEEDPLEERQGLLVAARDGITGQRQRRAVLREGARCRGSSYARTGRAG
jgi:hypothetical protein